MTSSAEIHNRELAQERLSREGRKYFKYIEFDANEQLITEIRKHPIGLVFIFLIGIFVTLSLLIISIATSIFDFDGALGTGGVNGFRPVVVLIAFALIVGAIVMTFIASFLYTHNVIYVTNEKLAQVLYISLFNRKISQLSIGDVQDVTVTQKGILAHVFNYGTLVVETAGEQQNYTFSFVPDPYQNSKLIVGAHERNLELHGN